MDEHKPQSPPEAPGEAQAPTPSPRRGEALRVSWVRAAIIVDAATGEVVGTITVPEYPLLSWWALRIAFRRWNPEVPWRALLRAPAMLWATRALIVLSGVTLVRGLAALWGAS